MLFIFNTDPCERQHSLLIDHHQKHITTGGLKIIRNVKLRKLLTKDSNHREPRSTDFNKAEITTVSDICIENLASKTK